MKKLGYMLYSGLLALVLFSVSYHWLQVGSVGVLGSRYPPDVPEVISHLTSGSMGVVLTRNIFGEMGLGSVDGVLDAEVDRDVDQESNAQSLIQLRLMAIATDVSGNLRAIIRAEVPGDGLIVRSCVGGEILADGSKVVRVEKGYVELNNKGLIRQVALFKYADDGGE